jgi:fatty-acyl-CoA synthase
MSTFPGLMMAEPLTITRLMRAAIKNYPRREIVSRQGNGEIFRYTYTDFGKRVAKLANALRKLGVKPGDRVASFGWNTHTHLELYYAVPCMGAVLHTTNIRLFPEQIAYVFDHAGDSWVFVDADLTPAIEKAIAAKPGSKRGYVTVGQCDTPLPGALDYETLIADEPDTFDWPELDENAAAILCYTSATTGNPKGVAFSHRSTRLHAYIAALPDSLNCSQRDTILPVVPMFHVNAWGLPYVAIQCGAKFVLPGRFLDAKSLVDLLGSEGVTISAGVPTVWIAVREELSRRGAGVPSLKKIISGGSAVPPKLLDDFEKLGIALVHAWGMTEMSPIGTVNFVVAELADASPERQREARLKQGIFAPGVEWKLVADDGSEAPNDGTSRGELYVRGPSIAREYYKSEGTDAAFVDGWFKTGDICTVDEYGYLSIVDRAKDLIKSGGEWISSVDVENALMGHPSVLEACVVGVPHEKWIERPVACVVLRKDQTATEDELKEFLGKHVAKWWIPDRVVFVESIPRTGVGKFLKRDLREKFAGLLTAV